MLQWSLPPERAFCAYYLPRVDARCLEAFLEHVGKKYADHRVVLVLDNAPSHLSKAVVLPENVSLLKLPPYSPELNPVERWFQEFRRELSKDFRGHRIFASGAYWGA